MNFIKYIVYFGTLLKIKPKRYMNLLRLIYKNRCHRILEIGTFDGRHAYQMIETSKIFYPSNEIYYFGFDLFELLSDEKLKQEFSKRPLNMKEVAKLLHGTGANIKLFKEDTLESLPQFINTLGYVDFIFIDGGHSIETITSDWNNVKSLMREKTIVVFDDYYYNDELEVKNVGCKSLIDNLSSNSYRIEMLKPIDHFRKKWGVLKVGMVKVTKLKDGKEK